MLTIFVIKADFDPESLTQSSQPSVLYIRIEHDRINQISRIIIFKLFT